MTNSADQISWLLQKPTDLDLQCLKRQGISGLSRTRVKLVLGLMIATGSKYYPLYTLPSLNDPEITDPLKRNFVLMLTLFGKHCSKHLEIFFFFLSQKTDSLHEISVSCFLKKISVCCLLNQPREY